MRASLFITCVGDTLFPEVGQATVALLERLGVGVDFPAEQTCCGQMHVNTGYRQEAIPLVRRMTRAFAASDVVVAPSASCVAFVRDAYRSLAAATNDAGLVAEVDALVAKTIELTELLVDRLGLDDVGASFPHRVTYHPTCHGLRSLQLADRPHRLLRAVRGLDLVELPEATECCGFGGTFAIKNSDVSTAMVSDKVATILQTGAEACVAADASCLMQIGGALRRQRTGVRTLHIAEVLAAT